VERLMDAAAVGDARAAGRLISLVEVGGELERAVSRAVFPGTGRAWVVGVTGAPGVGKSSLVDGLVACVRAAGQRVAVVAVDPSSPFSGGAILGDRVRMQRHATDPDVFVRSMATRGQLGGLARATLGAVRVLDAAGWPWIFVETVGAGQVEVDVAQAADATAVVLTPGAGDAVQVAKAGLMEVADLFVVNKSDRPGADEVVRDVEAALDLADPRPSWRPPVLRTVATTGEGVERVWDAISRLRAHLGEEGGLQRRRTERLAAEVRRLVREDAARAADERCRGPSYEEMVERVAARAVDPLTAAETIAAALNQG
jgi:LAO/AO transport system kinase